MSNRVELFLNAVPDAISEASRGGLVWRLAESKGPNLLWFHSSIPLQSPRKGLDAENVAFDVRKSSFLVENTACALTVALDGSSVRG